MVLKTTGNGGLFPARGRSPGGKNSASPGVFACRRRNTIYERNVSQIVSCCIPAQRRSGGRGNPEEPDRVCAKCRWSVAIWSCAAVGRAVAGAGPYSGAARPDPRDFPGAAAESPRRAAGDGSATAVARRYRRTVPTWVIEQRRSPLAKREPRRETRESTHRWRRAGSTARAARAAARRTDVDGLGAVRPSFDSGLRRKCAEAARLQSIADVRDSLAGPSVAPDLSSSSQIIPAASIKIVSRAVFKNCREEITPAGSL